MRRIVFALAILAIPATALADCPPGVACAYTRPAAAPAIVRPLASRPVAPAAYAKPRRGLFARIFGHR